MWILQPLTYYWNYPTEEEILEYLSGNLCRCSGYMSQLRAIKAFLAYKKGEHAV